MPRSHRLTVIVTVASIVSLGLAACGGSSGASSGGSKGGGQSIIGVYQPFTGPNAAFGTEGMSLCQAAAYDINPAGGILGQRVKCEPFDSTADPADALPVANRMIASTSNLRMIYGPSSVEPAVEPLINTSKLVHFPDASDPRYDRQTSPYFYGIPPSDSLNGVAIAYLAIKHGYTNVAMVFTTDPSAQTTVPSFKRAFTKLGGHIAVELNLATGQTSYRTEVTRVLGAKPDAIISEMEPQSAATFWSEMLQLNNDRLPPVIQTERAVQPDWQKAVSGAIGQANLDRYMTTINSQIPTNGPGYATFKHAILNASGVASPRSAYLTDSYGQWGYDGYILGALAITQAKTFNPSAWAPLIRTIANGSPGATLVTNYAEGVKALKAGKHIHFVGASGPLFFNQYNQNSVPFVAERFTKGGLVPVPPVATPAEIAQATG